MQTTSMPARNAFPFKGVKNFKQRRRIAAVTKRIQLAQLEIFLTTFTNKLKALIDAKKLKHVKGCPYRVAQTGNRVVIKLAVQAHDKITAKKFRELLGDSIDQMCGFEDDKSHDEWLHQCEGLMSVNGENITLEDAIASAQFTFGIRGRTRCDDEDVPPPYLCPIKRTLMVNPAIVCETGQTYERQAIEEWLKNNDTGD